MSKISRFTGKVVTLAKNAVGGRGESAATLRGGGFADYAVVSLHCLRIYLEKLAIRHDGTGRSGPVLKPSRT